MSTRTQIEVTLDGEKYLVEYFATKGSPGKYNGPPESCYEGTPDELEITRIECPPGDPVEVDAGLRRRLELLCWEHAYTGEIGPDDRQ